MSADLISGGSISADLISGGTIDASQINAGTLNVDRIPNLNASKITAGTMSADRIESNAGFTGSITASLSLNAPSVSGTTATFSTVDAYTHRIRGTSSTITGGSSINLNPLGTTRLTVGSTITADATIQPSGYNTKDLGSSSRRWRDIYTVGSVNTSDINFKTNIEELELGLDFIKTLEPIQFKWAATEDVEAGVRTHTGFSAQDIEQKLIDFGVESKDYALFTNSQITESPEDEPIYGLRSTEIISILTKAIQELSTQISDLTARVELLEG
jgi:hypothetical protein